MSYIDSHIHLADAAYSGAVNFLMENAAKSNVRYLFSNSVDYNSSVETLILAKRYRGTVLAAVGVHPWTVVNKEDFQLGRFDGFIEDNAEYIAAVGEIGLDGQYSQSEQKKKSQRDVFQFFLQLAERRKLPVIVHSRLAVDDVLANLSSFNLDRVLLHWYSGPIEKLAEIRDRGFMITVGPALLYTRRIVEIARNADLSMILTETDGPVRHHGPFEGKLTQPSFVIDVVRKLSEIKSQSAEIVCETVWRNFRRLVSFGPGDSSSSVE
jgi:TatD DNase family protein